MKVFSMNPSAPSDNSDPTFLVGADLVEFDRRDLPIYQTAEAAPWTCFDEAPYGAPLDRLFGEPGNVHIDGTAHEPQDIAAISHDPLVELASLSDGLALPDTATHAPSHGDVFGFGENHAGVHLHDGWHWDISGADWTFDFHS
jgi:hypothetical protein